MVTKNDPIRTEVVLKYPQEEDMIEFILESGVPRATLFKNGIRALMNKKEDEEVDKRIERILEKKLEPMLKKILTNIGAGITTASVKEVKPKKQIGFGVKKS